MTVEDTRGSCGSDFDDFPRGMRVLAVDDDTTCLKLLESLLRKCQYHVTLANQAKTALNRLRENRDRFDLIISDVHMPDMDGFKLLELVGLEMDLPVIMLSANSDPKLVMKGITHGACDYLVKPVRIEELRNIWQHVIRKKVDPKSRDKSNSNDRDRHGSEGGQGHAMTGNADQNGMIGRKRKDEEEEGEENDPDDDDPSTQKKPRVVWSIELHRKFVAAVNQLGLEKAVPKRILDLMNVDGLTRENVASHLQKYRLYLKRISSAACQQANMVAALDGKDAYLRMGTLDGLGDYRSLTGSGRILNTGLSSYSPRLLGQFNSPSGGGLRGLTSSAVIHPNRAQSLSNPINALGKFQPVVSQALQSPIFFHGIPSSLEFDQFQQSNATAQVGDFSSIDDQRKFSVTNTFTDARATVGCSGNLLPTGQSNPLILQGNAQQIQNGLGFINQSSINLSSLNSESFNVGTSGSSNIMDEGRCGENWQNAYQLSKFSSNTSPLNEPFNNSQMPPNSMIYNNSSSSTHIQNSSMHFSSNSTTSAPSEDSRGECQGGLVGKFVQNVDRVPNQRFRQHKQDYTNNSNNAFSTLNALATSNGGATTFNRTVDQSNGGYNRNIDVSLVGRSNGSASTIMQHHEIDESTVNSKLRSNEGYLLEQTKSHGGLVPNNYDSLDDIMNTLMKREQDGNMLMEGEFGLNAYTFGSCI